MEIPKEVVAVYAELVRACGKDKVVMFGKACWSNGWEQCLDALKETADAARTPTQESETDG